MRLKIRYDGESEKFCKIFSELNKANYILPYRLVCRSMFSEDYIYATSSVVSTTPRMHGVVWTMMLALFHFRVY